MSKTTPANASSTEAWQLYVQLEGLRPKIWRRLLVPATMRLSLLHVMLLWGMGWDGGHLHEFVFGEDHYGSSEPGWDLPDGVADEARVTLRQALGARKSFLYVYDFGDSWHHKVKVEKLVTLDAPIERAVCIGGENACPPEDVGGAPGYEEFLEALADPNHPDHEDLKEWVGRDFDPLAFSVEEVNRRLHARD